MKQQTPRTRHFPEPGPYGTGSLFISLSAARAACGAELGGPSINTWCRARLFPDSSQQIMMNGIKYAAVATLALCANSAGALPAPSTDARARAPDCHSIPRRSGAAIRW